MLFLLFLFEFFEHKEKCSIPRIILLSLSHALSLFFIVCIQTPVFVCLFDFKLFLLLDTKEQCAVCSQILNV